MIPPDRKPPIRPRRCTGATRLEGGRSAVGIAEFPNGDRVIFEGMHRKSGCLAAGQPLVLCHIYKVKDKAEAYRLAAGCNDRHGLPASLADKRTRAAAYLSLPGHATLSDGIVARDVLVSIDIAREARLELEKAGAIPVTTERRGADGKVRNVSKIGSHHASTRGSTHGTPVVDRSEPQWTETDEDREPLFSDDDWDEADAEQGRKKEGVASLKAAEKSLGAFQESCIRAVRCGAKVDLNVISQSAKVTTPRHHDGEGVAVTALNRGVIRSRRKRKVAASIHSVIDSRAWPSVAIVARSSGGRRTSFFGQAFRGVLRAAAHWTRVPHF